MSSKGVKGRPKDRLMAAETCKQCGWGSGTELVSATWTDVRMITKVTANYVVVETAHIKRTEKARTFPPDVSEYGPVLRRVERLQADVLSRHVLEAKAEEAEDINDKGVDAQLKFLLHKHGLSWIHNVTGEEE